MCTYDYDCVCAAWRVLLQGVDAVCVAYVLCVLCVYSGSHKTSRHLKYYATLCGLAGVLACSGGQAGGVPTPAPAPAPPYMGPPAKN